LREIGARGRERSGGGKREKGNPIHARNQGGMNLFIELSRKKAEKRKLGITANERAKWGKSSKGGDGEEVK